MLWRFFLRKEDPIQIKSHKNKIGSYCDTALFEDGTYDAYINKLVVKYYNKSCKDECLLFWLNN